MTLHVRCIRSLFVPAFALVLPTLALAGPPLLCFPISIDATASLPWGPGPGWNTPAPQYDRTHLVDDTVRLLAPATPVLVRMETLRRATIYASADAALSGRLIDALRARTTNGDALATFDFGYAVEVMRQAQHAVRTRLPVPADDGAALVGKALVSHSGNAAMHYAAALLRVDKWADGVASKNLEAAVAGASRDQWLARTIDSHVELWGSRLPKARTSVSR